MNNEILKTLGIKVKNTDNITKFLPVLSIINNLSLDAKIKILKFHKIPISKLSQLKILALESSELERRITISKSNNFFPEIILEPLKLLDITRYSLKKTKKITVNKVIDIPVKKEDKTEFIEFLGEEEFTDLIISEEKVEQNLEEEVEFLDFLEPSRKPEVFENDDLFMTEEHFEKYEKLSLLITDILEFLDFDLTNRMSYVDENLIKYVVAGCNDFEILYKALSFCANLNSDEDYKLVDAIRKMVTMQGAVRVAA